MVKLVLKKAASGHISFQMSSRDQSCWENDGHRCVKEGDDAMTTLPVAICNNLLLRILCVSKHTQVVSCFKFNLPG
jgi:hypothetical protein